MNSILLYKPQVPLERLGIFCLIHFFQNIELTLQILCLFLELVLNSTVINTFNLVSSRRQTKLNLVSILKRLSNQPLEVLAVNQSFSLRIQIDYQNPIGLINDDSGMTSGYGSMPEHNMGLLRISSKYEKRLAF